MDAVVFPKCLVAGMTIAVCNVSSHVPKQLQARLSQVTSDLRSRGFTVIVDENCTEQSSAVQQAQTFQSYLVDNSINAIMPPWGGDFALAILPHLNFEKIKKAIPKWIIGFSDISTVALALTSLTGWATCHASNLMQLNIAQKDPLTSKTFLNLSQLSFTQESSEFAEGESMDWLNVPDDTFKLTKKTSWHALSNAATESFSGRLLCGCLDTFHLLCCSRFFDIAKWKSKHSKYGVILCLENAELSKSQVHRALLIMRINGVLDDLQGVIFGRDYKNGIDVKEAYEQVFNDTHHPLQYPVLFNADLGHIAPNMTLVNGALVSIKYHLGRAIVHQSLVDE